MEKRLNEKFYGRFIREFRKIFNIPQNVIALECGISNTSLSKFESGQRLMSPMLFKKVVCVIEKNYSYCFNYDVAQLSKAYKMLEYCLQLFVDMTYKDHLDEIESYLSKTENKYSYGYFYWKLIDIFYRYFKRDEYRGNLQELIDMKIFDSNDEHAILYDLLALSIPYKEVNNRIECLKKARAFAFKTSNVELKALIDYHLILQFCRYHSIEALSYISSCEESLIRLGSYKRILHLKLCEGVIFQRIGWFSKAFEVYKYLERSIDAIQDLDLKIRIYVNYAWFEFVMERYREGIEKANIAIELGSDFPDLWIVKAFGLYRLHHNGEAIIEINEFLAQHQMDERSRFIKDFLLLLKEMMNHNENIEEYRDKVEGKLFEFQEVELDSCFYSLMADHYSLTGNYKLAFEYAKKQIGFQSRNAEKA